MSRGESIRQRVHAVLEGGDLEGGIAELCSLPRQKVINALYPLLYRDDEMRWRGVTAMGAVVAHVAGPDMEAARVMMRRFMWSLNDESGGIGWGAPECMAEAMARSGPLAEEYAHILVSYLSELEYAPLLRGAVWGVGRLAQVRPHLARAAAPELAHLLDSPDAGVRGLAAWAFGLPGMDALAAGVRLEHLLEDDSQITLYLEGALRTRRVGELAGWALSRDA